MKKRIFTGVATALITPMKNGEVDYAALAALTKAQIAAGIDALVACGTTGEGATLSQEEHVKAVATVAEAAAGRVPVIAGTGSNNTAYAVRLTREAAAAGADACLTVTPYYNKTTQKGLIASFTKIADESVKPIILYNVPSRTGVNIEPETYAALAEHENIVAIKEANGDFSKMAETARLTKGKLDLYSGNDDQILPTLALGGVGVISVLSNLLPEKTKEICDRFFAGDVSGARETQLKMLPLIRALFSEVNPIPVKAAMAALGYTANELRLPLTAIGEEHERALKARMREAGLPV